MALTAKKVYAILKRQISDMEAKLNSPVRYRGTVATADLLPLNPDIGDMYNIESKSVYGEAGMNVAWNGVVWDTMGAPIDMSLYFTKEEADAVIQRLVTEYFEKNPVKPGATAEQAQQIEQNKTDIGSLKTETGSLKEDIDEITVDEKSKNFLRLENGKESKDTYFDVIFADGLVTISKGITDWNNYLILTTSRKIVLDEGTYTFSIQNVSDDVNMGYIRLKDGNTEIASLSLFGSRLGVTSRTFILNNTLELTLEIEVNCSKLSDTPKSFNLQIEKGEEKTDYVTFSVQKMIDSSKVSYGEISKNRLYVKDMSTNIDGYCVLWTKNQIINVQKSSNQFPSKSYINRKLGTMHLKSGIYYASAQNFSHASEQQLVSISFKVDDIEIADSGLLLNIPSFNGKLMSINEECDVDIFITFIGDGLNAFFTNENIFSFVIMVEEGSYPSKWMPYENEIIFDKNIFLPRYVKNDLYGMTWNALGDSLTQPIGSHINYQQYISGKYGIIPNNYGVGGSTIAKGSNPMFERYSNMNDADIITVWGGTNDYGAQITIGDNDSTDTSTYKGALNVMIDGLINKYPSKRIGFITPMRRADRFKSVPLEMYVNAMIEICAKWCVPCLDLYHNGNLNPTIDIIANTYFRVVGGVSDKLHLNEKGQLVISRIIEDFLHRL